MIIMLNKYILNFKASKKAIPRDRLDISQPSKSSRKSLVDGQAYFQYHSKISGNLVNKLQTKSYVINTLIELCVFILLQTQPKVLQ